ncbi:hypothetical protein [Pandoraea eparura]|nr:hypothetical protein [Pandoraea eparura]
MDNAPLTRREFEINEGGALTHPAEPETATMSKQPPARFQRVLDELDAIGADTRPDLARLSKAIRAFGNAQYDPLWMGTDFARAPDARGARSLHHEHVDVAAAETFVAAMKSKLAVSHAKGRYGSQYIDAATLSRALREHVEKGDPVDVANCCMFLWMLGSSICSSHDCAADAARAFHQPGTK